MKKNIISILIFIVIYLSTRFISGYNSVNQKEYGKKYNSERKKQGISEIPESFILTEKPINNFLDYFNAVGIYSLEYSNNIKLDSGLIKKRIDIDETTIGIIREYSYYKKGNDTILDIHNYYK